MNRTDIDYWLAQGASAPKSEQILVAAFIDGIRVDTIKVATEADIPAAKAELLRFYPEAMIYRKL